MGAIAIDQQFGSPLTVACFTVGELSSDASSLRAMYGQSPNKASNSTLNASLSQCNRSEFVEYAMENFSPTRRGMLLVATAQEAQDIKKSKSPPKFPQASGGPKQPVIMGKKAIDKVIKENQPQVPLKMFHDWQCDRNSSNNGVLVLAKRIRGEMGRKFIQPGLKNSLVDRTKEMAQFYVSKEMDVRPGVGQDYAMKKKICVVCKNCSRIPCLCNGSKRKRYDYCSHGC